MQQYTRWFWAFLIAHVSAWTIVPALVRRNLPLDAIEGTAWGHQLLWGYDKNPFLNAWLTRLATTLGGEWTVYLFSQLSVGLCFWVIWTLGKKILTPAYALLAVMLLEGMQYMNFHAIDFNDNVLELGLWALTIYFFYQALCTRNKFHWVFTGLFAALSLMAKYYGLALIAALGLFLLCDKDSRKQLTTLPPYLGLLTLIIIITPHTIWLFFHDFITINYVFMRTSSTPSWTNHFFYPAEFAWQQAQVFLPVLIFYGLLFIGKPPQIVKPALPITTFNKKYIAFVALGPFVLTLLLSLITGAKLRAGWGTPLLSFWSLGLLMLLQPRLSTKKIASFIAFIFVFLALLLGGYTYSIIDSSDTSTANFPGKEIATMMVDKWHSEFNTKLDYVAGSRWLGGNIEFYSADHPTVFMEWNNHRSPWVDTSDLNQKGAIFIWDIDDHETLPDDVKAQFPRLRKAEVIEVEWLRNTHHLPPMKIGVAILPPTKGTPQSDINTKIPTNKGE